MSVNELIDNGLSNSSMNFSHERRGKRADSMRTDEMNMELQFDETPIWENKFMDMIEQMRTIPYVMLGHFQFIHINWIEDTTDENLLIADKAIVEEKQPTNNWELVKRMIFSKATKTMKPSEQGFKEQSIKSSPRKARKESIKNYGQQIVSQFNHVYDYFKDFISKSAREEMSRKQDERVIFRPTRSGKKLKIFKTLKSSKQFANSLGSIFDRNKSENVLKKRIVQTELNFHKLPDNENSASKKDELITKKNSNKFPGRILERRKEFLIDLTELASSKRFYRLNQIMGKDDGPFMTDYRFLLGVEFWSSFCGVEKHQLISVCSDNFWIKKMNLFQSGRTLKESQRSKSKTEHSLLSDLKQFLKGTDQPARAPQRVISSEEKFRLIPYPKLFNPNTDLKKTFHSNTIQDQLNKKLEKIYKTLVYLIGGKYPLVRRVGFEEAYEDLLLWVLDTYQAKTRFIALLNDQIKWEII